MEFGLSDAEVGCLTHREYHALWTALKAREDRRQGVQVNQMGHLIAMVANTGMVKWDDWRKAEEFVPLSWQAHAEPTVDLDTQLRRSMERLKAYQDGQCR